MTTDLSCHKDLLMDLGLTNTLNFQVFALVQALQDKNHVNGAESDLTDHRIQCTRELCGVQVSFVSPDKTEG